MFNNSKAQVEFEQENGTFIIPTAKTVNDLLDEYISIYGVNTWALSTYESRQSILSNYVQDIAAIVCLHDMGIHEQSDLLNRIWELDRMYLLPEIRYDRKRFQLEVEHQTHYFYDKPKMDLEFPLVQKDAEMLGKAASNEGHGVEFSEIDLFFKNIRYRLLFIEDKECIRMKLSTLLAAYGYKRRTAQLVTYIKERLQYYHLEVTVRNRKPCDIGTVGLNVMIMFRLD